MAIKVIKVGVRCQYWVRPEFTEIEVDDEASEQEIEDAMREAAMEMAKIEWWAEE